MSRQLPSFVALPTAALVDDDLAALSDAEFRLFVMGLVKAKKTHGQLRVSRPGMVQRWASLDGGTEACAAGTEALIDRGWWVADDEGVRPRCWEEWQSPVEELEAVAATMAHQTYLAGEHPSPAGDPEDGDRLPTLTEMAKALLEDLDEQLRTSGTPLAVYRAVWDQVTADAQTLTAAYPTSKDPVKFLRLKLLAHAMNHFRPGTWSGPDYSAMNGAAEALGAWGVLWLVKALHDTAGAPVTGSPTRYVVRVAYNLRDEAAGQRR